MPYTVSTVTRATPLANPAAASQAGQASDTFVNDGKTVIRVDSSADVLLTVTGVRNQSYGSSANQTYQTGGAVDTFWGPFPTNFHNNLSGNATLTIDTPGSVNLEFISMRDAFN